MSELTDKMRTCAAFMIAEVIPHIDDWRITETNPKHERVMRDAVDLLIEASNALEIDAAVDLGEPMAIIPPLPPRVENPDLPVNPRACPTCGIHAANIVRRQGAHLMLSCPACGTSWAFKPQAQWT
jgi:hypothetical protein